LLAICYADDTRTFFTDNCKSFRNAFAYGEEDITVLAVALMAGISRAHAFEQGNKRTAFAAMRLFLRANGYDTAFDDSVSWADEMISLIEHRSTEEDFVRAVRPFIVPARSRSHPPGEGHAVEQ